MIPDPLRGYFTDDGSGTMIPGSVDELERARKLREGVLMDEAPDAETRAVLEL
jgi:hypothetical protein